MRGLTFAGWVAVGALGAFTSIAILSIGIFVMPSFLFAGVLVSRRTRYPLDVLGVVAGLGVPLLAVALANRDSVTFDPDPWWVVGATLVGAGVGMYVLLRLASRFVPCRRSTV